MSMSYRETGLSVYGHKCELCGFSVVEVHHIGYQLHTEWENKIRSKYRAGEDISIMLEEVKALGFLSWNGQDLSKDNRSTNLAVLCGNCHSLVHLFDAGMNLLKALPKRI